MQKGDAQDGEPFGVQYHPRGAQPMPLVIEGFEDEVEAVAAVLSSIQWHILLSPQRPMQTLETLPEKWMGSMEERGCILLMDVRRHPPGWRQPLTRIETGLEMSGTLLLVLAESGDDFTCGDGICHSNRWRFSGSITPDGIGVLVKSVFRAFSAWTEMRVNPSSTPKISSFKASPPAHAERD
jgi:hypothetical protein